MIRHWRAIATSLAGLVGVAGIMWVYLHYEAAYPDRYLAAVRRALDQGDRHEVDRLTNLLDHEGAADHVHFIRGEIALRQARDLHKDLELLGKSLQAERALRLGCGAALALCQPAIGREGCLLEIAYLIHTDIGSTVSVRRQTLEEQSRALLRSALWDYHHISKHDPLALEAAAPSGECFLRLKELGVTVPLGEAIKRLRVAVSREPENLEARRWLASLYLDMKAPHEAIAELQEVGRLAPDDGRPYRIMGLIYKGYHQREQAKTAYEEALRRHLEPHVVAEVLLEYSEVLVDTGHPTEALERLAQCPERFGEEPYALALKGECLWQLGRVDEATVLVDRALHADSNSLPGLRMRASIYLELQQPEKALPLLVRYVHLDPISNQARKLLAQTYRLLGETGKAEEQTKLRDRLYDFNQKVMNVNTELIKNPQNDELRYQIGMLWLGIGQYAEARQWFISALEINAKNSKAKQALEQIDPAAAAQFGK